MIAAVARSDPHVPPLHPPAQDGVDPAAIPAVVPGPGATPQPGLAQGLAHVTLLTLPVTYPLLCG